MRAFIFERWHAWDENGKILLSDESTKTLREFGTPDDCINWLYTNDAKPAARALNKHARVTKARVYSACRQTACRFCDLDIEGFAPYRRGEWRDRGNNTKCYTGANAGKPHAPVKEN